MTVLPILDLQCRADQKQALDLQGAWQRAASLKTNRRHKMTTHVHFVTLVALVVLNACSDPRGSVRRRNQMSANPALVAMISEHTAQSLLSSSCHQQYQRRALLGMQQALLDMQEVNRAFVFVENTD